MKRKNVDEQAKDLLRAFNNDETEILNQLLAKGHEILRKPEIARSLGDISPKLIGEATRGILARIEGMRTKMSDKEAFKLLIMDMGMKQMLADLDKENE